MEIQHTANILTVLRMVWHDFGKTANELTETVVAEWNGMANQRELFGPVKLLTVFYIDNIL